MREEGGDPVKEDFQKWKEKTRYDRQTDIVKKALSTPQHSLNKLLDLMRSKGEAAIYLCGTRLDNDYGFGSNDIGTAISVLPEDGDKALEPGYHPGSTEVYIIFQGSLVIETLVQGSLQAHNYGQFDVIVLPPGVCHRVRFEAERCAASFIVKTNPHHEPKVVRCKDCVYFTDKSQCALARSWQKDEERIRQAKPA